MTETRSHREADCRYCQRYGTACGRHVETIASATPLVCSECGKGRYVAEYDNTAKCSHIGCGHTVYIPTDVSPHLDRGEYVMERQGLLYVVATETD